MAESGKKSYPQLPSTVWWNLRKKFLQSLPTQVTEAYVETVLNVKASAARIYISQLKEIGLLNDKGQPTSLALDWRNDKKYAEVCRKIIESIYPEDLRNVAPPPSPDRDNVVDWFIHSAKLGEGSAKNRAAMYLLLAEADPSKEANSAAKPRGGKRQAAPPRRKDASTSGEQKTGGGVSRHDPPQDPNIRVNPSLQLNVEIHIDPETSIEQIDAIFASMAKHLSL